MQLLVRRPDQGYLEANLWVPKTFCAVEGVKRALTFQFFNNEAVTLLTLWKETEHHIIVPREFWDPKNYDFPVVDLRPQRFAKTSVTSKVKLDHEFEDGALRPTGKTVQRDAMELLMRSRGGILQLACGLGKAQPLATPVLTPTGWRALGALQPGDYVIGSNGFPTQVLGVFQQGRRQVYRVTMEDGASTRCCDEHLWFTQTPSDRRRGEAGRVRTTAEVRSTLRTKAGAQHAVPRTNEVHFSPQPPVFSPWLMGFYLGDGNSGVYNGARRLQFSKSDAALHDSIDGLLHAAGTRTVRTPDPRSKNVVTSVRFDRDALAPEIWRELDAAGLIGVPSVEKYIPAQYFSASVQERWELLKGLLDSDGSVTPTARSFSTSSPRLREGVTELARSLGIRVFIEARQTYFTHKGVRRPGAPSWRLSLSHACWGKSRYEKQYIQDVAPAGEEECVCIKVAAPDSLYVTENFIVTHNTVVALDYIARRGFPAIIILDTTELMRQWKEEIEQHLDIPGGIGLIQGETRDWKKPVVLATYHSLAAWAATMPEEVRRWFGTAIWDEAHHVAAPMFSRSADLFYGVRLGLTATPNRDDGYHVVYDFHLGPVIYKNLTQDLKPRIYFVWTGLGLDANDPHVQAAARDVNGELHIGKISSVLGAWPTRIDFVLNQVRMAIANDRKVLVLSKSVDALVNLLAAWNKQQNLITDIPFPQAADVGESVPPAELSTADVVKLTRHLFASIKHITELHAAGDDARAQLEAQKKANIEFSLEAHRVYKKCALLWNKQRAAYLKTLLAQPSTAGLMIYKVKPDERAKMLREKQVTFAISKYGREGLNERSLDTIIMNEPLSSRNALQQLMGRVLRKKKGKQEPVVVFLEDDIGPFIGMCRKLRSHLSEWAHDEGGPFAYENVGYGNVICRRKSPSWKNSETTTFGNRTTSIRSPGT